MSRSKGPYWKSPVWSNEAILNMTTENCRPDGSGGFILSRADSVAITKQVRDSYERELQKLRYEVQG